MQLCDYIFRTHGGLTAKWSERAPCLPVARRPPQGCVIGFQHRIIRHLPTSESSSMKKMNSRVDLTDKVLNDPARTPGSAPHQAQVSPPYSNTVLPPPSSPTHPGPSIDSHSEVSLTKHAHCCIGNELTSRCRCTPFAKHPATTAVTD